MRVTNSKSVSDTPTTAELKKKTQLIEDCTGRCMPI